MKTEMVNRANTSFRPDRQFSVRSRGRISVGILRLIVMALLPAVAMAQSDQPYHPLNQQAPTGKAAAWMNHIRHYDPSWQQPISVELPGDGEVSVYSANPHPSKTLAAPATFAVNAGHVYRLRIRDMAKFPGVELYPSIEILDRLHPPAGQEFDFPIPIPISEDDIRHALDGKLVTRVIYLEQPQLAQSLDPLRREVAQSVSPSTNSLKEADRLGRPMVIVRIGGRRPAGHSTPATFFGTGGMVSVRPPSETVEIVRQPKQHRADIVQR